jgi:hypothetical protein
MLANPKENCRVMTKAWLRTSPAKNNEAKTAQCSYLRTGSKMNNKLAAVQEAAADAQDCRADADHAASLKWRETSEAEENIHRGRSDRKAIVKVWRLQTATQKLTPLASSLESTNTQVLSPKELCLVSAPGNSKEHQQGQCGILASCSDETPEPEP